MLRLLRRTSARPRFARTLETVGRVTLAGVGAGSAAFVYVSYRERSPGAQLAHDESKPTLVVLGSGWGATSLLKALDTTEWNVVVVSPKNYFLFTPLLPSVAVGTLSPRSILQPTRHITRFKTRAVDVIEAEAKSVDPVNKTVTFADDSEIQGRLSSTTIPYDYLVYAVGAEVQTFGIPGVQQHACFMKELHDAEKLQRRFMDCIESAAFPGQSQEEIDRLLHMVVVGGGPTGIELSGELHDFLTEDLKSWYPELAPRIRITLVEALPSVLPTFSKKLIEYTESTFRESRIEVLTRTMVKGVGEGGGTVMLQGEGGQVREVGCGMVVWAAGNTARQITRDLMAKLPDDQKNKRGIEVDDYLQMKGTSGTIFALGDCTASPYAPTAQVAAQQGAYLARVLARVAEKEKLKRKLREVGPGVSEVSAEVGAVKEDDKGETEEVKNIRKQMEKIKFKPFRYSHQGSLAYIGSEKAIADLPFFDRTFASGGVATYLFWRSAYLSNLFSLRNRTLVATDWLRTKLFGRDVSRD